MCEEVLSVVPCDPGILIFHRPTAKGMPSCWCSSAKKTGECKAVIHEPKGKSQTLVICCIHGTLLPSYMEIFISCYNDQCNGMSAKGLARFSNLLV